LDNNNLLAVF